jgi:chromosome segregation ATPase
MAKYKKPGVGRIIAALAKEWKEKRDQEASRHENDTVAQRVAEKEQAFQREQETFNNTLQGKDRDITNIKYTVESLTSRLSQVKRRLKERKSALNL